MPFVFVKCYGCMPGGFRNETTQALALTEGHCRSNFWENQICVESRLLPCFMHSMHAQTKIHCLSTDGTHISPKGSRRTKCRLGVPEGDVLVAARARGPAAPPPSPEAVMGSGARLRRHSCPCHIAPPALSREASDSGPDFPEALHGPPTPPGLRASTKHTPRPSPPCPLAPLRHLWAHRNRVYVLHPRGSHAPVFGAPPHL